MKNSINHLKKIVTSLILASQLYSYSPPTLSTELQAANQLQSNQSVKAAENKANLEGMVEPERTQRKRIEGVLNQFNNQKWGVTYNFLYFFHFPTSVKSVSSFTDGTGVIKFEFSSDKYIITHVDLNSGKPLSTEWNTILGKGTIHFDYKSNQIFNLENKEEKIFKIKRESSVNDLSSAIVSYLSEGLEEGTRTLNVLFRGKISPYTISSERERNNWKVSIISGKNVLGRVYVNNEGMPIKGSINHPIVGIEFYKI